MCQHERQTKQLRRQGTHADTDPGELIALLALVPVLGLGLFGYSSQGGAVGGGCSGWG